MFRCHALPVSERLYWPVSVVHCVTDQIIAEEAPCPYTLMPYAPTVACLALPSLLWSCFATHLILKVFWPLKSVEFQHPGEDVCLIDCLEAVFLISIAHPTPNQVWGRK